MIKKITRYLFVGCMLGAGSLWGVEKVESINKTYFPEELTEYHKKTLYIDSQERLVKDNLREHYICKLKQAAQEEEETIKHARVGKPLYVKCLFEAEVAAIAHQYPWGFKWAANLIARANYQVKYNIDPNCMFKLLSHFRSARQIKNQAITNAMQNIFKKSDLELEYIPIAQNYVQDMVDQCLYASGLQDKPKYTYYISEDDQKLQSNMHLQLQRSIAISSYKRPSEQILSLKRANNPWYNNNASNLNTLSESPTPYRNSLEHSQAYFNDKVDTSSVYKVSKVDNSRRLLYEEQPYKKEDIAETIKNIGYCDTSSRHKLENDGVKNLFDTRL